MSFFECQFDDEWFRLNTDADEGKVAKKSESKIEFISLQPQVMD